MHIPILLSLTLAASLTTAHTVLTTLWIDGKNQGDGTCIRMGLNPDRTTFPISSLDAQDMACGLNGNTPVTYTCPASTGSKITFAFRSWADDPSRGPIDKSHVGAISIYLKKLSSPSASAPGGGWFKIFNSGYSLSKKKWSATTLNDNHGLLTVSIPSGIPSGSYLVRTEIIALQNYPDPQVFVNCAQLYITSSSSTSIPNSKTVSIPGHLHYSDPGLTYDIYENTPSSSKPYPIPGPKVYFPSSSSSSSSTSSSSSATGLVPSSCILKNANWCAKELPDYSTENECWKASDDCWAQVLKCYDSAPPSGYKGCKLWSERKCDVVQKGCKDGEWNGPKNKGKKVAEEKEISEPIPGGNLPGVDVGEGRGEEENKEVVAVPGIGGGEAVVKTTLLSVTVTTATTSATSASATSQVKGGTGSGGQVTTSVKPVATAGTGGGCGDGRQKRKVVVVTKIGY